MCQKVPWRTSVGFITVRKKETKNIFFFFLPLINAVFLDSWLSLADHQTRCSINYAWLDLNGFFTGRLGLVIREPTHVEQPCPLGRGITPVERKPTLWHVENRGKHHFSSCLAPPSPPTLTPHFNNVPTAWSQKQISHLLPDYGLSALSYYICGKSCQPFDRWHRSFVFAPFNVAARAPSSRSWRGIKTGSLFSAIIQMRSSLAEIVQKKNKNNHTRLN